MHEIQTLEDFNFIKSQNQFSDSDECILRLYDNKSNILLQTIVVSHPISFLRNLPDVSKQLHIPISDIDIILIGFINLCNGLIEIPDRPIISPYLYFKKPDDVSVNVGSADSTPPVES